MRVAAGPSSTESPRSWRARVRVSPTDTSFMPPANERRLSGPVYGRLDFSTKVRKGGNERGRREFTKSLHAQRLDNRAHLLRTYQDDTGLRSFARPHYAPALHQVH